MLLNSVIIIYISMNLNFQKLKNKLQNLDQLRSYINQESNWIFQFGFFTTECPLSLLESNPELIKLIFEHKGKAHFLKLEGWKLYNLHMDIPRKIAINSVLQGFDCYTFFTDHIPNLEKEAFSDIIELTYDEGDIIMLNVTRPHGLYNRSQTRVILSLSFNSLDYTEMHQYLLENQLI